MMNGSGANWINFQVRSISLLTVDLVLVQRRALGADQRQLQPPRTRCVVDEDASQISPRTLERGRKHPVGAVQVASNALATDHAGMFGRQPANQSVHKVRIRTRRNCSKKSLPLWIPGIDQLPNPVEIPSVNKAPPIKTIDSNLQRAHHQFGVLYGCLPSARAGIAAAPSINHGAQL